MAGRMITRMESFPQDLSAAQQAFALSDAANHLAEVPSPAASDHRWPMAPARRCSGRFHGKCRQDLPAHAHEHIQDVVNHISYRDCIELNSTNKITAKFSSADTTQDTVRRYASSHERPSSTMDMPKWTATLTSHPSRGSGVVPSSILSLRHRRYLRSHCLTCVSLRLQQAKMCLPGAKCFSQSPPPVSWKDFPASCHFLAEVIKSTRPRTKISQCSGAIPRPSQR